VFDVIEDREDRPLIQQLSVFLPNRVGALLTMTRALDSLGLHICALAIVDAADHAVARLIVDRPELAKDALEAEGHAVVETELVGVAVAAEERDGIRKVLQRLLMAELNVHYLYSFAAPMGGGAVLALLVEDSESAARVLNEGGFELVGQDLLG
jgi:hypothetical protein